MAQQSELTPEALAAYYKVLVENLIRENERGFIFLALADFRQGFREQGTAQEQTTYCKTWVKVYQGGKASV